MATAIEMFFDDRADAAVRRLWRRLEDAGLPSLETFGHARHRPHVSLTVASGWDPDLRPDVLAAIGPAVAARQRPRLDFPALATFAGGGGVLFLAVTVTSSLLALHQQVDEILRRHQVARWPQYLPGSWVPHCTLGMDLPAADVSAAVGLLSGFEPFRAQVVEIGVTDTSTGTVSALG